MPPVSGVSGVPVGGATARINSPGVDSTPSIDTSQPLPQNLEIAQQELKGWIAKRVAARQVSEPTDDSQATAAAQAAMPPPLAALTGARKQLDQLENALKGIPSSMRDALATSLSTGQPPPPSLKGIANLATQTAQAVAQQMAQLPPDARNNVLALLNVGQNYPLSDKLLNAMPVAGATPAATNNTPAIPLPANLAQAVNAMGTIDNPNKLSALVEAAKKDGLSPEQLVDQLTNVNSPISKALLPRMNIPSVQNLGLSLTPTPNDGQAYMQRLDGLQKLVTQMAGQGPAQNGRMTAADMNALLASGRSPQDVANALINNTGNPARAAMTVDALNALQSRLLPSGPMDPMQRNAYLNQLNALQAMQSSMPATAWSPGQNPIGQTVTGAQATLNNGFIPTGNTSFDLANSIANSAAYSPAEQALLNQIQDPQQRAMQQLQMFMQKQALLATALSNLANMRHEMLKTVANNLRA